MKRSFLVIVLLALCLLTGCGGGGGGSSSASSPVPVVYEPLTDGRTVKYSARHSPTGGGYTSYGTCTITTKQTAQNEYDLTVSWNINMKQQLNDVTYTVPDPITIHINDNNLFAGNVISNIGTPDRHWYAEFVNGDWIFYNTSFANGWYTLIGTNRYSRYPTYVEYKLVHELFPDNISFATTGRIN